jgi:general secretion pathway protein G
VRWGASGFTIIEILVVLVVIATLAALVAPELFRHVGHAREQQARQEIAMLDLALRSYHLDNAAYPTTEQGLGALRERPSIDPVPWRWKGPYLRRPVPRDPWGHAYVYTFPVDGKSGFDLRSLGADGAAGGEGDDADLTVSGDTLAAAGDSARDSVRTAPR